MSHFVCFVAFAAVVAATGKREADSLTYLAPTQSESNSQANVPLRFDQLVYENVVQNDGFSAQKKLSDVVVPAPKSKEDKKKNKKKKGKGKGQAKEKQTKPPKKPKAKNSTSHVLSDTQKSPLADPVSCLPGWTLYSGNNKCYRLTGIQSDWTTQMNKCASFGGGSILTSIHTRDENKWLDTTFAGSSGLHAWVGLSQVLTTKLSWVDGTPVDYTWWMPGYTPDPSDPPAAADSCVEICDEKVVCNILALIYTPGQMDQYECSEAIDGICSYDPAATTTTTSTSTTTTPTTTTTTPTTTPTTTMTTPTTTTTTPSTTTTIPTTTPTTTTTVTTSTTRTTTITTTIPLTTTPTTTTATKATTTMPLTTITTPTTTKPTTTTATTTTTTTKLPVTTGKPTTTTIKSTTKTTTTKATTTTTPTTTTTKKSKTTTTKKATTKKPVTCTSKCAAPWVEIDGNCYAQVKMTGMSWGQANRICTELGATLGEVTSASNDEALRRTFDTNNKGTYIGQMWIALKEPWKTWKSGASATYTNWGPGQPNNAEKVSPYCATFIFNSNSDNPVRGSWNDVTCSTTLIDFALCQKPAK